MGVRRVLPTSFTAGRPLTLEGVDYAIGDPIPQAVVARVRRVPALLSRRWIVPNTDPYASKLKPMQGRPVDLNASELKDIAALP
jgi:hypothetical protein